MEVRHARFVTGASGWIGSALVPELIGAGHEVTGLARSDVSAAALTEAGARVHRGDLDDPGGLRGAAGAADGVIHLAFNAGMLRSGHFQGAVDADRRAVEALGEALTGSDRPLVIASATVVLAPGRMGTEQDAPGLDPPVTGGPRARSATDPGGLARERHRNGVVDVRAEQAEQAELVQGLHRAGEEDALSFASLGVRSSAVRLGTTCHGDGDHGFLAALVGIARDTGVSGFTGDGSSRWTAVHRLDAAHLFRLALEKAPAGSRLHAVADEGVPIRAIAEVIGRHLDVPVVSVPAGAAIGHFGFLAGFLAADNPVSSTLTRELLGWQPAHPGLIEDLDKGHYFHSRSA
jgi:nucleoside-diphosphate-sugar epimerase